MHAVPVTDKTEARRIVAAQKVSIATHRIAFLETPEGRKAAGSKRKADELLAAERATLASARAILNA